MNDAVGGAALREALHVRTKSVTRPIFLGWRCFGGHAIGGAARACCPVAVRRDRRAPTRTARFHARPHEIQRRTELWSRHAGKFIDSD